MNKKEEVLPVLQPQIVVIDESKSKTQCPECGKLFNSKQSCNIHMKTLHRGERRFKCEQCGRSFGHSATLNKHALSHFPKTSRGFACDICGKVNRRTIDDLYVILQWLFSWRFWDIPLRCCTTKNLHTTMVKCLSANCAVNLSGTDNCSCDTSSFTRKIDLILARYRLLIQIYLITSYTKISIMVFFLKIFLMKVIFFNKYWYTKFSGMQFQLQDKTESLEASKNSHQRETVRVWDMQ